MSDDPEDAPISAGEVDAQLPYLERAMSAADQQARTAALADGLLAFGDRFVMLLRLAATRAPDATQMDQLATQAATLHLGWLKGRRLTDRADEPERRAHAARRLLDPTAALGDLAHYAAHAILDLPETHPLRDAERARAVLVAQVRRFRAQPEQARWVFVSTALALAYDHDAVPADERDAWDRWAEDVAARLDPEDAASLWLAIERHYLHHLDEVPEWRHRAEHARARIDALTLPTGDEALRDLSVIATDVVDDDQDAIADRLQAGLDGGQFAPHVQLMMAAYEARLRLRQGDDARVQALLVPRLDAYEAAYVTSVRPEERTETGARFAEACGLLAFSHARRDQWTEAVAAIERGKCVRQRYARALRRDPELAHLLDIEADLYAAERGVDVELTRPPRREDDWLGHDLAPEAALREAYRRALPRLDATSWQVPPLADVAAALRPGEALLSLGQTWAGLMAALIVRGDATPAWTQWRGDVDEPWIMARLAADADGRDGFLVELERVTDLAAQRATLERLLADLDEVLGAPVAAAMRRLHLHRLVVVPHRFLRLVPLWALPSWVDLDVRMAPDLSSIVSGAMLSPVTRRALLVGNPTGDLPLTPTEAAVTARRMRAVGIETLHLQGPAATEAAVVEALPGVGILHFAGHGHASLTNTTLSGLLVHPVWDAAGVDGAASLVALADAGSDSPRLTIDHDAGDPHRRIYLDHARSGTLFADEWEGAVTLAGELWRVGDILVQGSLDGCGLAFLCACSSGLGALTDVEEATGVPASLDLAGVRTVVATGWPVTDALALLFAEEFYTRALADARAAIDVVACVRASAAVIRSMASADAARRLDALATEAPDATGRFRLRATARRIANGPALPFAHPFDWGAFHVTGAAELRFADR